MLNIFFSLNISRRILIALFPPPSPNPSLLVRSRLAQRLQSPNTTARALLHRRPPPCPRPCASLGASSYGMVDCPRLLLPAPRVAAAQYTPCAAGSWLNQGRAPFSVCFSRRRWSTVPGEFASYARVINHRVSDISATKPQVLYCARLSRVLV